VRGWVCVGGSHDGEAAVPGGAGSVGGLCGEFDPLFASLAQRRGFREYLTELLAARDRNKTLTALAGAEPVVGAQHPAVQRLQFFLSESRWDHEAINTRRLELLLADPATAPHTGGALVIDDSGDAKTAQPPRTSAGSGSVGWAKPTTGTSPSPPSEPMSGSTTRCTPCPTPRPSTSRRARPTSTSGPSCRSEPSWRPAPARPDSSSGRWPPMPPTATRTGSAVSCAPPGCPLLWP
jgi:hypothetical protein